ncbi:tRNA (adenosine(37)-N6)-threonylcarbamoyltransferase complex dimerization subunit type 1 TsaB [Candidatus Nanosynbacter sp. TM7-074]|uniref:tRNA (Adenosine(37)-N6)-threonylcarbamoyltransferase complex dimerization subunit type 1 TsaB n=1 Tax=Candidatus Nanosynbacter sp. TM7-074 TaxID=3158573 RepID=A0AB39JCH6_9BACT
MIILLDTSTATCFLTLVDDEVRQDFEWQAGRTLARGLLKFLEEKTGDLHDISGIGVMKGPGSFTGLRIGLTVANTLADSLNVPIVGATGEDWREMTLKKLYAGENEKIVMPEYGAAAHVTSPRK